MSTITTKDGTRIFYKDWGSGQPIVFHHGWPLSADDWDNQMLYFLEHGYRVIAHDRRGHGRSTQTDTGNDMAFSLQLPVPVASLVIDTDMSTVNDTVLSLKDAACGVELACDDDGGNSGFKSMITAANVPAGNYAIQVDSYSTTSNGAFTLQVKGTVAAQTACSHAHFAAGILVCPTGTTCTGTPKKCQ